MDALLKNESPFINGDGTNSRDFTFVANAVEANIRGMLTDIDGAAGKVYNIAYGERTTISELFEALKKATGSDLEAKHRDPRPGDIPHSLADISLARKYLGYDPKYGIEEGLEITFDWFKDRFG